MRVYEFIQRKLFAQVQGEPHPSAILIRNGIKTQDLLDWFIIQALLHVNSLRADRQADRHMIMINQLKYHDITKENMVNARASA